MAILGAGLLCLNDAGADSVVVFNEIMYHPVGPNEAPLEWIELQNQLCVDVDVSGWRLDQAIHFRFAEGTIIPGGGFLVVASSPSTLAALGVTNALGPFTGRLGNGGDTLQLLNNSDRIMDEVAYGTVGDWPVAPDGVGPALARRATNVTGANPANWGASAQIGGTPGLENFPVIPPIFVTNSPVSMGGLWKFNNAGVDFGTAWRNPDFDDSGWSNGAAIFFHTSAFLPALKNTPLNPVQPTSYFRTQFIFNGDTSQTHLALSPLLDDGAVIYLNGTEVARVNMPDGSVSFKTLASAVVGDAALGDPIWIPSDSLRLGSNTLAVEVHQAGAMGAAYPQAVLNSGPVGYWRLGEAASPALDSASAYGPPQASAQNGNFAGFLAANLALAGPRPSDTVNGAPLMGFELDNRAPRCAGNTDSGDDVVLISDPGVFNFAAKRQFTLEAWVNGATSQESGAPILCKGTGSGGEQYCMDVTDGNYRFYIWDAGGVPAVASASVGPNNSWQHVVGVYDPSNGLMNFFVNGVVSGSGAPRPTLHNTTHEVSIGARQLGSGAYDLNFDGRIDEVAIYDRALSVNEIRAHYYSGFTNYTVSGPDTNDVVFALQLTATEAVVAGAPQVNVRFNELASSTNAAFWVELINIGSSNADMNGYVFARFGGATNREYVFPSQILPSGACLAVTQAQLGFGADPGDRLVLYAPNRTSVLDAVVASPDPRGRRPDGAGPWFHPTQPTPGASNIILLRDEIVINEIMYHPQASNEVWLELFNRSTNVVDLAGWSLAGGIGYNFGAGRTLAPGGYLVVANDPAHLLSLYPGLDVVGPFTKKLSTSGELISLKDSADNPANEVRYYNGGRWSVFAAGGGSSLELRDPRADNTAAEAWGASEEGSKSSWQTYIWRGLSKPGQADEPTLWNEFALCLIDGGGEVFVDDIRVTETPATTPKQLVQNGSFNAGNSAHWRFLGTHRHSRVEPEPGNPGNFVLHLIATGYGEYQGNQIETTLTNNTAIVDGREYEISFRAKWLAGKSLLNSRLYFNRLARTVQLKVPALNGTPGAVNSRHVPNLGPTFNNLRHAPVVPESLQPVTVSAGVNDPDGLSVVTLHYLVAGGAWRSAPMSLGVQSPTFSRFSGTIPGQAAGSVVQFYIQAADVLGAASAFPAGGANSRALYVVQDGQAASAPLHNFRIIMTTADATFLHTGTNTLSNELLGCTVVENEREAFYDAGVRLQGSFVGRNVARVGFHVEFQPDRLFRGVHNTVGVDRSQHALTGGVGEIIVKHLAGHAGRIPNMYDDLTRFTAPLPAYDSMASLRLAGFGDHYLNTQFRHGSNGSMYEPEVLRWELSTVDGNPESTKLVGDNVSGTGYQAYDLQNYGDKSESYRWSFPHANNRTADDFSVVMDTCSLFSLVGTNFSDQASRVLDTDEWCRVLAFQSLIGPADAYYTGGGDHNYRLYLRPEDARVLYLPWDWDSCFLGSATASLYGSGNVTKLFQEAEWNRAYLNHLYDLIKTSFNPGYAGRWTAHYGALSGQDFSSVLSYIDTRATYIMGHLPTATPFDIANNGGHNFSVTNGLAVLSGTAPISVNQIEVNGTTYPITWTSATNWTIRIPLNAGATTLTALGFDQRGIMVSNALASIVVTNTGPDALLPLVINEWMADNKAPGGFPSPSDGLFHDWFELFNPNTNALDLSGFFLTDALSLPSKWQIPTNVFISGRGFLLVWADGKTNQNPLLGGTNVDLHASFQLNNGGEAIGLFAKDGATPLSSVAFGEQIQNVSQGRFPDGDTNAPVFMTNWTPRAANTLASLSQPHLLSLEQSNRTVTLICEVMPQRTYQLQFKPALTEPTWSLVPLATAERVSGRSLVLKDVFDITATNRFYRVMLLP
jgi:hypothetical protein